LSNTILFGQNLDIRFQFNGAFRLGVICRFVTTGCSQQ
jgi:hypothetical protein